MEPNSAQATLEQWQRDEAAVRERLAEPGVASFEQVAPLDGLTLFAHIFDGKIPPPTIGETLGFLAVEVAHGRAVFQGAPNGRVLNPMGTVHGGWYAAILDSAVACAVHSTLPVGRAYTTLEIKVNIVRALPLSVPRVRAIGEVVHAGRQVATAEGRLVGPDGTLFAHASTTCLIFDARPK